MSTIDRSLLSATDSGINHLKRSVTLLSRAKGGRAMSRYVFDPLPIGEGGFGKIRKGSDPDLDRPVAIKSLDPLWLSADEEDRERFRREAKVLAKLAHPNIPAVYDVEFGTENNPNEFRIIFQYIDGENLRTIMTEEQPSLLEVRAWFEQIASALEHAHEKGIFHRDIKPENLVVTRDRKHCYLVDFGLALSRADVQRLTPSGFIVGTPGYMSPEQENGDEPHQSDDLYVLGVVLYEVLAGHRIHAGDYEDLNTMNESIPKSIDDLIQNCIQPKAQRLGSAAEFGRKLMTAFQTHAPLSTILSQGQLYEVMEAIRIMTPSDFMILPPGQRKLILRRGADVIASPDPRLSAAKGDFLPILTTLTIHVSPEDYQAILVPALEYGFARVSGDWTGDRRTREAIVQAASVTAKDNHHVIVTTLLNWVGTRNLAEQDNWLLDGLRRLIQPLMANGHCSEPDATNLDRLLADVNRVQRDRQVEAMRGDTNEEDS